jgi:hypothetical protein
MKPILALLFLFPGLAFCQHRNGPRLQAGGGFLFYPGSSSDVRIADYSGNPLKSGFSFELTADQPVNHFLLLGLGASLVHLNGLGHPYVPVFADIRIIGTGRYKLYSFLDPGYGIFHHGFTYAEPPATDERAGKTGGGFYIAYGFGVIWKMFYLQGKYHWLRFSNSPPGVLGEKTSKAYGVAGITIGVYLR